MPRKLLDNFRSLFDGVQYRHRDPTNGDRVSSQLYEDLYDYVAASGAGGRYRERIENGTLVYNRANRVTGKMIGGVRVRRGDGLLGQAVPGEPLKAEPGYQVRRGAVANIQIGVEVKIVSTAMSKQFDRVVGDILKQHKMFTNVSPDAVTFVVIGVNHSPTYRSFEGDKFYDSSPQGEASRTMLRLRQELDAARAYDDLIFLPFSATNLPPHPFAWVNWQQTNAEYNAALVRLANLYAGRFP